MYHVIVANFHHETNTFSTESTGLQEYKDRAYALGQEIVEKYAHTKSEVGGFIEELEKHDDIHMIPVIMADAQPSGPVTAAMYEHVCDEMHRAIEAAERVDGILLSLHGAMVTENSLDGEGDFLEMLRNLVGEDVPIVATFDLHSILTEKKCINADVMINYDEYPHIDMFERGQEAAAILVKTIRGMVKPCQRVKKLPLILPSISSNHPVMKKYMEIAHNYEKDSRVLTVSISYGFHFADVPELGVSVVAVTDNDPDLAETIVQEIGDGLWENRKDLQPRFYELEEAMDIVEEIPQGPIVVADVTDNPGGGASCDGTAILRALIDRKAKNVVVAHICDGESLAACYEAGVGQKVKLRLGGKKCPPEIGGPICCEAYVKMLTDGKYTNIDAINGGYPITLGKTALIMIEDIAVIVTNCIEQPFDRGMLYAHGIDPERMHCIVLKSTVHFRAAYEQIATKILPIHIMGGLMTQDLKKIAYSNVRRPVYPLDAI